jgi:hypothetical protein
MWLTTASAVSSGRTRVQDLLAANGTEKFKYPLPLHGFIDDECIRRHAGELTV